MIAHYLKIAWRNLRKYKTQTIISMLGLTIGVVFFAYGYHWYQYETSYDSFYPTGFTGYMASKKAPYVIRPVFLMPL